MTQHRSSYCFWIFVETKYIYVYCIYIIIDYHGLLLKKIFIYQNEYFLWNAYSSSFEDIYIQPNWIECERQPSEKIVWRSSFHLRSILYWMKFNAERITQIALFENSYSQLLDEQTIFHLIIVLFCSNTISFQFLSKKSFEDDSCAIYYWLVADWQWHLSIE